MNSQSTTCVVSALDRPYTVPFNLAVIGSVEESTGQSMAEINNTFVAAGGRVALIRVGFLHKFALGALVAVDPTFKDRAADVLTPDKIHAVASSMADAWNAATALVFNLKDAEKKTATDAPESEQPGSSPNAAEVSPTPST